jgi:lipopolysaccharide transport system ATP-binding protein
MDYYNVLIADRENATVEVTPLDDGSLQTRSGSGEARIDGVNLRNARGEAVELVPVGDAVSLRVRVRIVSDIPELVLGYVIKDRLGQPVFGTNTYYLGCSLQALQAGERVEYRFGFPANLGAAPTPPWPWLYIPAKVI